MDELRFTQQAKPIEQLLRKNAHKRGTQAPELILFNQLVQIHRQQLEHQTQMLSVDERVLQPQNMMVIVLVHATIQEIQHRHLHHALVEVGSLVLDHFDGDNLLSLQILTFDDLAEGALPEHVENQIPVLVVRLFGAEDVVHVEDVIAVFVVVSIVLGALARLGKHSPWVS